MLGAASSITPSPPQASSQASDSDPEANLPFLFAVYILTWAGFFGYAFYMSRRQRDLRRDIDALRQDNNRDAVIPEPSRMAHRYGTVRTRTARV